MSDQQRPVQQRPSGQPQRPSLQQRSSQQRSTQQQRPNQPPNSFTQPNSAQSKLAKNPWSDIDTYDPDVKELLKNEISREGYDMSYRIHQK